MLSLLVDENFNADIVRGRYRRRPELNVESVHRVGLVSTPDDKILAWAANENRIVVTHDRNTLPKFAIDRVKAAEAMPCVFLVSDSMLVGQAIDELLLAADCLAPEECRDQIIFFPF